MKQSIGILAMSCKPVHAGHLQLINIASKENDLVKLFVSMDDRKRKGEVPIYGADMEFIWKTYLEHSLPGNVELIYTKSKSPIRHVYEFLGNNENSDDTYVIYSDPNDIERNFSNAQLEKYLNTLQKNGKIHLEPISRSQTTNVSGTKMRKWLETGNKEEFINHLPAMLQDSGEEIWNTFSISLAVK